MKKTNVILLTLLISCASAKDVTGPDGTPQKLITCGQLGKCYEKAAEECHGSFKQINAETKVVPGYNGTTTEEIKLLVKCE